MHTAMQGDAEWPQEAGLGWREEAGYTLVELAVASLLVLLVGSFCFTLFVGAVRWVEPWRREIVLENQAHLAMQRLLTDLAAAEQFVEGEEPGTWLLAYPERAPVEYRWHDGVFTRSGHALLDAELELAALRLTPSRPQMQWALRPPETTGEAMARPPTVEVALTVRSVDRALTLTGTATLRRHRPWRPVR